MNNIIIDQNKLEFKRLLAGQRIVYSRAKKMQTIDLIQNCISIVSPFLILFLLSENTKNFFIVFSAFIAIVFILVEKIHKLKTNEGANIQEQFDTKLFGLEWNKYQAGNVLDIDRIILLSENYKDDDLKDWYSIEIKPDLHKELAILLCQKSNLSYDTILRIRFRNLFFIFTVSYYFVLCMVLFMTKQTLFDSFVTAAPSFAFGVYTFNVYINQTEIIKLKEDLSQKIKELFDVYQTDKKLPSMTDLRKIQDKIFELRSKPNKIPDWFYSKNRNKLEYVTNEMIKTMIVDYKLLN